MSELNQETSGSESESSASENSKELNDSSASENSVNEKLLREKKNAMKGIAELRAQLEEATAKIKATEEEKLLADGQKDKVIEILKEDNLKLKESVNNFTLEKREGKKTLSILSELKKLGFVDTQDNREMAFKLLDKQSVEIDDASGVVMGADTAAKTFFDKYNSFPIFGKKNIGTANNAPSYGSQQANKSISSMTNEEKQEVMKASLTKLLGS